MKDKIRETLAFQELTPEEKEKRGILCRLYGPCADIEAPTRNGRKYSDEVWENVFTKNEIVKELLANGGIPGEAQHPTDREEIDVEKIAIMMPEAPKRGENGNLIAYFDVQDTPCGRILYQLAKYGFKLGISSRGTGDIIMDADGQDCVDPETYDFTCFDAVIIPSVKAARLQMVESLDTKPKLKEALIESLNKANPDDRKLMEETLQDLKIDISTSSMTEDYTPVENGTDVIDESVNIQENNVEDESEKSEVSNAESANMVTSLTEALKTNAKYEYDIKELNEKLVASNARINELESLLSTYETEKDNLVKQVTSLEAKSTEISKLQESLETSLQRNKILNNINSNLLKSSRQNRKDLSESLNKNDKAVSKLKEEFNKKESSYRDTIRDLNEQVKLEQSKHTKECDLLKEDLNKYKSLAEKYSKVTRTTINKYIESKANLLGVSVEEIKNKLDESFTINDVDKVCEDLKSYNLNMSKLPFNLKNKKVKIKESKESDLLRNSNVITQDDDIDDDLITLAGLK